MSQVSEHNHRAGPKMIEVHELSTDEGRLIVELRNKMNQHLFDTNSLQSSISIRIVKKVFIVA